MSQDPITTDVRETVTIVTMDDGKVNALSRSFLETLGGTMEKAVAQEQPVVLTGNGRAFSAGLDLKEVPTLDEDGLRDLLVKFEGALHPVLDADVPVIAAIDGFAIAGGAIIALCCDYRVGGRSAEIGATEFKVGIPFPPTDMNLFTARLPIETIRRTIMDPNRLEGEDALRAGWFDQLAEAPVNAAIKVAGTIGGTNREAFAALKRNLNEPIIDSWSTFLDDGADAYVELLRSETTQEAILEGISQVMGD